MEKKTLVLFLSILLSVTSWPANAAYTCSGTVKGVAIEPNGQMWVESLGGLSWVALCSVTQSANGVSVDACKTTHALLLTAAATNKTVTLWFNDSGNCSTHAAWAWLTGWNFGPRLD